MHDDRQHHIGLNAADLAGNGALGRYVFLPGDRSRAARIAAAFTDLRVVDNPRGLTAHLGRLPRPGAAPLDVLSISSGMGTPSTEIVLHELIAAGARRIVRVGSCGALTDAVPPGSVVVVDSAVRDESTTGRYAPPEVPAVPFPGAVAAFVAGARAAGLGAHTFVGPCHTKDSLYAREFGHGPLGATHKAFVHTLAACGVIASDMEAALLFIRARIASAGTAPRADVGEAGLPVSTACVLGVYAGHDSDMHLDPAVVERAQARAIAVALDGVRAWAAADGC